MRHRKKRIQMGRATGQRQAVIASVVRALIDEKRVITTLAKAKRARTMAEKLVTAGRKNASVGIRRISSRLASVEHARKLVADIVPRMKERPGGYTRILKMGPRRGDGSEKAVLEWVDMEIPDRKRKTKKEKPAES
ncbi:MAG: 50S ribosomal protein L17 [Kiritimatiellia bacterium]